MAIIKPKFWYGWVMVFICWFFYFVNVGFPMNAVSVMNTAMVAETGMNAGVYGIGSTIFNLLSGLLGFIVGPIIAKRGAKLAAIIGTVLIIVATGMMGLFGSSGGTILWMACYGIIMGVGCCFGTALPAQTGVMSWHKRKRATAMGFTMTASALGGFIAVPIVTKFVTANGWTGGWMFVCFMAIVNLIVIALFMINKPEDIGQQIDNGKVDEEPENSEKPKNSRIYVTNEKWTVAAAMRKPATWFLLIALIGTMCAYIVFMNQGLLLLMNQGFELATASGSIQIILICSLVARLICGWLGDRINPRIILICTMSILVLGIFICSMTYTIEMMYVFAVLVGLGYGGSFTMIPLLLGNYYGAEAYPRVYGTLMPFNSIITALAPTVAGFIYEGTGAYTVSLYVFAAIAILGIICVVLARPPKMSEADKAKAIAEAKTE